MSLQLIAPIKRRIYCPKTKAGFMKKRKQAFRRSVEKSYKIQNDGISNPIHKNIPLKYVNYKKELEQ